MLWSPLALGEMGSKVLRLWLHSFFFFASSVTFLIIENKLKIQQGWWESVIMGTADLLSDVILHQPMKTALDLWKRRKFCRLQFHFKPDPPSSNISVLAGLDVFWEVKVVQG